MWWFTICKTKDFLLFVDFLTWFTIRKTKDFFIFCWLSNILTHRLLNLHNFTHQHYFFINFLKCNFSTGLLLYSFFLFELPMVEPLLLRKKTITPTSFHSPSVLQLNLRYAWSHWITVFLFLTLLCFRCET